jgi:hypothetical protein
MWNSHEIEDYSPLKQDTAYFGACLRKYTLPYVQEDRTDDSVEPQKRIDRKKKKRMSSNQG